MPWFAKEDTNSKELREALEKMDNQMRSAGGQFTFNYKSDDEGWMAKCKEFDGIVTGGINKNPSEEEVMQSLIDAIKTAFDIPINKLEIKKEELQKLPMIKLVREYQFV